MVLFLHVKSVPNGSLCMCITRIHQSLCKQPSAFSLIDHNIEKSSPRNSNKYRFLVKHLLRLKAEGCLHKLSVYARAREEKHNIKGY